MKKKNKPESIVNYDDFKDAYGAVVPPIYQNSLFSFQSWEDIDSAFNHKSEDFIYSRLLNPTAKAAEDKIAALAGGEKAKLCASGIAAITSAILHCISIGGHIVTINNIYGPSTNFISKYLKNKFGIESSFVDGKDINEFEKAIRPNTQLIYLESPASLNFELQDLQAISKLAKSRGIKTVIDNTFATPVFQKPLELGIDIEVHSVSKYICGHSDVIAGVIISDTKTLDEIMLAEHELLGAKIAPFEAWLILRSLRTLPIRMKAHQENAQKIAIWLDKHPKVDRVHYVGMKSFPQYELACRQMSGFSGLMSFELATKDIEKIKGFVNELTMFKLGVSWGGHDSLVYAPVISYLKELRKEQFEALGIVEGLIRISIGLEHPDDLIEDLSQAMDKHI